MKIITILLLMISTQVQALGVDSTPPSAFSVEQCNEIANVAKKTIEAAISGVAMDEAIDRLNPALDGGRGLQDKAGTNGTSLKNVQVTSLKNVQVTSLKNVQVVSLDGEPEGNNLTAGTAKDKVRLKRLDGQAAGREITKGAKTSLDVPGSVLMGFRFPEPDVDYVGAIYETVNQIKMKYGHVREQDKVRLNDWVGQQAKECGENALKSDFSPSK